MRNDERERWTAKQRTGEKSCQCQPVLYEFVSPRLQETAKPSYNRAGRWDSSAVTDALLHQGVSSRFVQDPVSEPGESALWFSQRQEEVDKTPSAVARLQRSVN